MSYSTEVKDYLQTIDEKRECCNSAYKKGLLMESPEYKCDKDIGAYLRGAFIAAGSITDPKKEYHIEFKGTEDQLEDVGLMLEAAGISFNKSVRRGRKIIYTRDSGKIEDFLAVIGGGKFALQLMEHKVIKNIRLDTNRKNNAEVANIEKTTAAAAEQINAINKLKINKEFERLPEALKETALMRLEYPDLSIEELRSKLDKPISKSGLNHRLKRLIEIAGEV